MSDPTPTEVAAAEVLLSATLQELGRHLAGLAIRGRAVCDRLEGQAVGDDAAYALGRLRAEVDQAFPLLKMFLPPHLEHLVDESFPTPPPSPPPPPPVC